MLVALIRSRVRVWDPHTELVDFGGWSGRCCVVGLGAGLDRRALGGESLERAGRGPAHAHHGRPGTLKLRHQRRLAARQARPRCSARSRHHGGNGSRRAGRHRRCR
jgi:hypothetical protein